MAKDPVKSSSEAKPSPSFKSLYVGDLDSSVTENQLYDFFNQVAQVVSVRICKDTFTQESLGYGYVNFSSAPGAATAIQELNFSPLNGKTIRVMYSIRDPSVRKSGEANIYIKNLDKSINGKALFDIFKPFGKILSCKIATDDSGESKCHGFVQFESEASAKEAIHKLNGTLLNGKKVYVGPFVRKQDREGGTSSEKFNNVYVKNLSKKITDADLQRIFGEYGAITSAVVMKDLDDESKGFGFVNFANADDAANARAALDGKTFDGKKWYVGRAQRKSERELELKERNEQNGPYRKEGTNLYIKNLDNSIGDEELKEIFSGFGTITSSKVMRDPNGISKGSAFVSFTNKEAANKARESLNGRMTAGKPLYVALAEKKEDRKARLEAQFLQRRAAAQAPRVQAYPTWAGSQILYRQIPPTFIPQVPFYLPHLVRGMRPTGPSMPGFYPVLPYVPNRPRVYRGQPPAQLPLSPEQMLPSDPFHCSSPASAVQYSHPEEEAGEISPLGRDGPVPIETLPSAIANANNPQKQRILLGETLFPLVEKLEPDAASKVTGMILEMDNAEVLHLIESPDELEKRVAEAMDALRQVAEEEAN